MSTNHMAQAAAVFRRMLSTGKPVAFEDAAAAVKTPEDFDRRTFGCIPAEMARDGEIVEAGFRVSKTARHHRGVKRLWVLAHPFSESKRSGRRVRDCVASANKKSRGAANTPGRKRKS